MLYGELLGVTILESLSKPGRQRQRERHKTKGLMSRTVAFHVRYISWYISRGFSRAL